MKRIEPLTQAERDSLDERVSTAEALSCAYASVNVAHLSKVLQLTDAQAAALDAARSLVQELTQHLDYIGWGDSYEREHVCAKGGLEDRAEAFLAEHPEVSK